jgi:uncharacterized protein YbjT (DUF2867 family)
MKIVIIGGTGLIGSKVVKNLKARGHDAVAASPRSGVNAVTGDGLSEALAGTEVVVDVSNSPSWEDRAVLEFFERSTGNLMAAEKKAGVKHHAILSVVGADRMHDSGYMRAKVAQESLVRNGGVPYSIVRATQFYEFISAVAEGGAADGTVRLTSAPMQPIAAEDVAAALTDVTVGPPVQGIVDIAGPEKSSIAEFARRLLQARGDSRPVVAVEGLGYFGQNVDDGSLCPIGETRIGAVRFENWLKANATK